MREPLAGLASHCKAESRCGFRDCDNPRACRIRKKTMRVRWQSRYYPPPREETSELLSQRQFFVWRKFGSQRRTAQFQTFAIDGLVIRRSRLPATKDDTDPLKSESAESRMMRLSTFAQLVVMGSSPIGFQDRAPRKLVA